MARRLITKHRNALQQPSVVAMARDVAGLTAEYVANLVEQTLQPVPTAVFPGRVVRFASKPRWVRLLRGDPAEDADDQQRVAVFRFASSTASFRVKQELTPSASRQQPNKWSRPSDVKPAP
jgi:hypothetical protein